jgi:hypothetical protein
LEVVAAQEPILRLLHRLQARELGASGSGRRLVDGRVDTSAVCWFTATSDIVAGNNDVLRH